MAAPPVRVDTLRRRAIAGLDKDGLPKVPLVLELAEEVRAIQARRKGDSDWVYSAATPRDRKELARRRERLKADEQRLEAIGRFLALAKSAGRTYKLTPDDWFDMLGEQDYRCAICLRALGVECLPCIDHNHATGEVRGLLCGPCNTSLGVFKDSPAVLRRALGYLEERGFYGPAEES